MLIFIVGGSHQGKHAWAEKYIASGGEAEDFYIVDALHLKVKAWLAQGLDPERCFDDLLKAESEKKQIIITDEIGCGIIPMDPQERRLRELHGRLCCKIAAQADEMYQITMGLGRRLK